MSNYYSSLELIEGLKKNNPDAEVFLIDNYKDYVYKMVKKRHDNKGFLDDDVLTVLHETIQDVKKALSNESYEHHGKFDNFFITVAKRRWIDLFRSRVNEPKKNFELIEDILSGGRTPEEISLENEKRTLLESCLENLKPLCRTLIQRKYVDGWKRHDIANDLGLTIHTLKYHLSSCIKIVRVCLKNKNI